MLENRKVINEFKGKYRFLSNFWPASIEWLGQIYPTVEHAYQAAKTDDYTMNEWIRSAPSPGEAKRRGRSLKTTIPKWESIKLIIMSALIDRKFTHPELAKALLNTGNSVLEEGNLWGDEFWGVDLRTGKGANHLGIILMETRDALRCLERN